MTYETQGKIYQVFISSPYRELKEQRKALIAEVIESGHLPAAMELFSAGDEDEFEVIKRAITQSDIYVVLLGSSFGSPVGLGRAAKSFTRLELDYAKSQDKHIVPFLLEDKEFESEMKRLGKPVSIYLHQGGHGICAGDRLDRRQLLKQRRDLSGRQGSARTVGELGP